MQNIKTAVLCVLMLSVNANAMFFKNVHKCLVGPCLSKKGDFGSSFFNGKGGRLFHKSNNDVLKGFCNVDKHHKVESNPDKVKSSVACDFLEKIVDLEQLSIKYANAKASDDLSKSGTRSFVFGGILTTIGSIEVFADHTSEGYGAVQGLANIGHSLGGWPLMSIGSACICLAVSKIRMANKLSVDDTGQILKQYQDIMHQLKNMPLAQKQEKLLSSRLQKHGITK